MVLDNAGFSDIFGLQRSPPGLVQVVGGRANDERQDFSKKKTNEAKWKVDDPVRQGSPSLSKGSKLFRTAPDVCLSGPPKKGKLEGKQTLLTTTMRPKRVIDSNHKKPFIDHLYKRATPRHAVHACVRRLCRGVTDGE